MARADGLKSLDCQSAPKRLTHEPEQRDEKILVFTISLAPVSKKNSPQIRYKGKCCPVCKKGSTPYVAPSKVYEEYAQTCSAILPGKLRLGIDYPVNIAAVYYMPTLRRVDITNLHSALHDVLVAAGVLADDSSLSPCIVVGTDGSRVCLDRKNPRTEVVITRIGTAEYKQEGER